MVLKPKPINVLTDSVYCAQILPKLPGTYLFIYLFIFLFSFIIHMCIQGLVHFSPLPPPPPLPPTPPPPSPPPSIPSRNYFALISNFVVERV
jgi:hypothetical protein